MGTARAEYLLDLNSGRLSTALVGPDGILTEWLENTWARQVTARAVLKAPVDTGNLRRTIHPEPVETVGPFRARVAVVADANYAIYVHEGIASPRQFIVPIRAKALRFYIKGKPVFASRTRVSDKQRGRPFLRNAAEEVTALWR